MGSEGCVGVTPDTPLVPFGGRMSTGVAGDHLQNLDCVRRFAHLEGKAEEHESRLDRLEPVYDAVIRQGTLLEGLATDVRDIKIGLFGSGGKRPVAEDKSDKSTSTSLKWFLMGIAFATGGGVMKLLEVLTK